MSLKPLPSARQLSYLIALVETGHFGRAAKKCAVTQSTLSAGLKELEAILGSQVKRLQDENDLIAQAKKLTRRK